MTEEQQLLLHRRLQEAAEKQPEIAKLRMLLLNVGGEEFVPSPNLDPDVPALIEQGALMKGHVISRMMEEGYCHENVSELWFEKDALDGIGDGYALSDDGLWRQHSWGIKNNEIIETTSRRMKYFGRLLLGSDADQFADANRGDPDARYWRRLPRVFFRLQRDEDGYPEKDWEGLKSEPTGAPNTYRIMSSPFFDRNVAFRDEVLARASDEGGFVVFHSVTKRSGYSTVRLLIQEEEDTIAVVKHFRSLGCLVQCNGIHASLAIPQISYEKVSETIDAGMESGRWGADDGYLASED